MNTPLTFVLGAQKNSLIKMVLLSTHNICFGLDIKKIQLKIVNTPLTFVLGAQKNRLIKMVLLSTHIICFG